MFQNRQRQTWIVGLCLFSTLGLINACELEPNESADVGAADASTTGPDGMSGSSDAENSDAQDAQESLPPGVDERVLHKFGDYELQPGEEVLPCVQWSLNNDEPIYVNEVALANGGTYHHSNWYVTPENYVPGKDGYFDCDSRGFEEVTAAIKGTALFAQSTQARSEIQKFKKGAVIKIPPNHKIIGYLHFLNISTRKIKTYGQMTLGLSHPKKVETVLAPFRLSYLELDIPPKAETRVSGSCNFKEVYEDRTGKEFDMDLYYVLPHYHGLGNYFKLEYFGGPKDGEKIYELEGFNAEANGKTFENPLDVSHAKGFTFTCGFRNPRDEKVGWGVGDQEMCVMLGFADSRLMIDASVQENRTKTMKNGRYHRSGPCEILPFPKNNRQSPPTKQEKEGEMYVPEGDAKGDVDPIPECKDRPGTADPQKPPTLTNLEKGLFTVGCAYSACHSADGQAGNLNFEAEDLHSELMKHEMVTPTDMPLVDPGKPENSWLYEVTSNCKPESKVGPVSHMPRNSPTLLEPKVLAMIREWIANGAKDN